MNLHMCVKRVEDWVKGTRWHTHMFKSLCRWRSFPEGTCEHVCLFINLHVCVKKVEDWVKGIH